MAPWYSTPRMRATSAALLLLLLASAPARAEESAPAPEVQLGKPKLMGGTVTGLDEALEKTRDGVAACVASHGGLDGEAGRVDVQFLVRERGKAEGVEVTRAQKVSEEAALCVQRLLKNRAIGKASDDPVGVVYSYRLKRR